jgi:hypothetical protein
MWRWNDGWSTPWVLGPFMMIVFVVLCGAVMFFMMRGMMGNGRRSNNAIPETSQCEPVAPPTRPGNPFSVSVRRMHISRYPRDPEDLARHPEWIERDQGT